MAPPIVRLGLIGHGTVGSAFVEQFLTHRKALEHRAGARLVLAQIAVREPRRHHLAWDVPVRGVALDVARDPSIDIVVEVSGAATASTWLRAALERGASVVTANKQAVARDDILLAALARGDRRLHCEGAVAAAVPIVRALRESLAGEEVLDIRGVLNGTTTFILSRLERGRQFDLALAEARAAGFAEADPVDDLSGADAAAKLAILSTIAWRAPFSVTHVSVDGLDWSRAAGLVRQAPAGSRVRLVAHACRDNGRVIARVGLGLVEPNDALAVATGVVNVVEVQATLAGTLTWTGAGAGGRATASALLGDVLAAARSLVSRRRRVAA